MLGWGLFVHIKHIWTSTSINMSVRPNSFCFCCYNKHKCDLSRPDRWYPSCFGDGRFLFEGKHSGRFFSVGIENLPRRLCVHHPRWRLQCAAGHCYYQLSVFLLSFFSIICFRPTSGKFPRLKFFPLPIFWHK